VEELSFDAVRWCMVDREGKKALKARACFLVLNIPAVVQRPEAIISLNGN
jgi:hypothetical protein